MTSSDPGKGSGPGLCLSYDSVVKQHSIPGGQYTDFTVKLVRMLTEEKETAGQS